MRTELELQQLQAEHEKLRRDYNTLLEQMRVAGQKKVIPFPKGKS
jgi:hypothetical protein